MADLSPEVQDLLDDEDEFYNDSGELDEDQIQRYNSIVNQMRDIIDEIEESEDVTADPRQLIKNLIKNDELNDEEIMADVEAMLYGEYEDEEDYFEPDVDNSMNKD